METLARIDNSVVHPVGTPFEHKFGGWLSCVEEHFVAGRGPGAGHVALSDCAFDPDEGLDVAEPAGVLEDSSDCPEVFWAKENISVRVWYCKSEALCSKLSIQSHCVFRAVVEFKT
jgi:hypothetical protein